MTQVMHLAFMRQAMALALRARGQTSPNPLVGAVVVKEGKRVAEGWHRFCGGDHAEVIALKKLGSKARGASLYVTLEPCSHFGQTPPCVDAIIQAGIKEVIIGVKDPNPVNNGRSIQKLRAQGIKTQVGFLEKDLMRMNESFNKFITRQQPFVTAKCAQTLDGRIALADGRSQWITGQAARAWAHDQRNEFDAIMVGINTVLQDDPRLNPVPNKKRLKKIIVDSRLRIPEKARLWQGMRPGEVMVATTTQAANRKFKRLQERGAEILVAPANKDGVDLRWLLSQLAKRQLAHVLLEGGSSLLASALRQRLVDKLLVFIAPKIMGAQNAMAAFKGLSPRDLTQLVTLSSVEWKVLGPDFLLTGYVNYPR